MLLRCLDSEPNQYHPVSTEFLKKFDCRLSKLIEHGTASFDPSTNVYFYDSYMTKAMLPVFLRSLLHSEISLSKEVSLQEALTTLEYEGVYFTAPPSAQADVALSKEGRGGPGFPRSGVRVQEVVRLISDRVATALLSWPKLQSVLEAALGGVHTQYAASASRVWVCLAKKPSLEHAGTDSCTAYVNEKRKWLIDLLVAFGAVQRRLHKEGHIKNRAAARSEKAFTALEPRILGHPLGVFLPCATDTAQHAPKTWQQSKASKAGDEFCREVRKFAVARPDADDTLPMQVSQGDPPVPAPVGIGAGVGAGASAGASASAVVVSGEARRQCILFSRAAVKLAEQVMRNTPSLDRLLSAEFVDSNDKSMERTTFAKAMTAKGIKVIQWAPSGTTFTSGAPLLFPPHFAQPNLARGVPPQGPLVLLDFSDVLEHAQ